MVQAIPSKTDARATAAAPKDKDRTAVSDDLSQGMSSLFAQYLAAMPAVQTPAAPVFTTTPVKPRTDPATQDPSSGRAPASERTAPRNAPDPRENRIQAASSDRPQDAAPSRDRKEAASGDPGSPSPGPGGNAPTDPAEAAAKDASPKTKADPATPAGNGAQASASSGSSAAPASGAKGAGEALTPAQAQEALKQQVPQAQLQNSGDEGAPAQGNRKPALSEFLNQPKVDIQTPSFMESASSPEGAGGTAAPDPQATLQAPMPNAQAAALLAMGQGPKEASAAPNPAGTPGTPLPTEAVGAAAAPGASGAVRVAPTPTSQASTAPRRETPMAQVDSSIRWLIKNKEQSAELQLHPESLGKVQIKLTVEGSEVHAKLWASDASAMPVLQEHRAQLEASLKDQGLSLGSFDLQQGRRSDQGPQPQPDPSPLMAAASPAVSADGQDSPSVPSPDPAGAYRIEIVA